MPLPKSVAAALKAWKAAEGEEIPDELQNLVVFENDGQFMNAVKQKLSPAEKAAKQAAINELLGTMNIKDPEELEDMRHKLAESQGLLTEVEKLRADTAKSSKLMAKLTEENAKLVGFQHSVLKGQALDPLLNKIHPDGRAAARKLLEVELKINGDKVQAPDGVELDAYVDEFVKANPIFKAPETTAGAGTGPTGEKPRSTPGASQGGGSNGTTDAEAFKTLTPGQALARVMAESTAKPQ